MNKRIPTTIPDLPFLALDIGRHTGFSFWKSTASPIPSAFGTIHFDAVMSMGTLALYASRLKQIMGIYSPQMLVLEGVEVWGNSQKSIMSAVSGDLMWLAYMLGVYAGTAFSAGTVVRVLNARQWKGQLTKHATKARLKRLWPSADLSQLSEHEIDAICMGMAHQGRWSKL